MIVPSARINLLPYRERRVKELTVHFFSIVGVVIVFSVVVLIGVDSFLRTFVTAQNARVELLNEKIAEQDREIADIAKLKKEIEGLIGRKSVIESLQDEKNNPIRLFNALSKAIPPQGLYLETFSQTGSTVTLSAVADGNARISSFITNLDNSDGVFKGVNLVQSQEFPYGTQKFFRFSLTMNCPIFRK